MIVRRDSGVKKNGVAMVVQFGLRVGLLEREILHFA